MFAMKAERRMRSCFVTQRALTLPFFPTDKVNSARFDSQNNSRAKVRMLVASLYNSFAAASSNCIYSASRNNQHY